MIICNMIAWKSGEISYNIFKKLAGFLEKFLASKAIYFFFLEINFLTVARIKSAVSQKFMKVVEVREIRVRGPHLFLPSRGIRVLFHARFFLNIFIFGMKEKDCNSN